ncbi:hypothetical protein NG271_446 [Saccharomyces cerevisiae synthetic construct]|uniref:Putative uncharacterized protein YDR183C-A n=2 Tax=Saccharomyces cerevisiae TaxID=4932 RepID=YD83A_YEAST|nr:RecName: Full=Putative uncharacterized protein YDR183C-A [Saccharomyces cerevisiae S288C]EWG87222.1 hypothetical protein R008_D13001 [Saccharomyces cerevisiae R008]EWG91898.1 hypothetical protein P301_D13016 [Saccharomyces cerevisiae P301]EWG97140.1 hypothetical protein R103_D22966 [Saccharomyces cerevisiae R103]WNF20002.1 hypothetical protein NG271_446 [Saccharomyces cerevisiae synthetic construct]CAY78687.1 EC1118_1D0_4500p [Saccharomyces cerevisiae EC1118]
MKNHPRKVKFRVSSAKFICIYWFFCLYYKDGPILYTIYTTFLSHRYSYSTFIILRNTVAFLSFMYKHYYTHISYLTFYKSPKTFY